MDTPLNRIKMVTPYDTLNRLCGLLLLTLAGFFHATGQSTDLGIYPDTSVVYGRPVILSPKSFKGKGAFISAYANNNFKGSFFVDTSNGNIYTTPVLKEGSFTVTVVANAKDGKPAGTSTFNLRVLRPPCSTGAYIKSNIELRHAATVKAIPVDINKDGFIDIVSHSANSLALFLGKSNGGFEDARILQKDDQRTIANLEAADYDGDGQTDLAYTKSSPDAAFKKDTLYILYAQSIEPLRFQLVRYKLLNGILAFQSCNLNRDAFSDLVVIYGQNGSYDGEICIFTGAPDRKWKQEGIFYAGLQPSAMHVADFNGDQHNDAAITLRGTEKNKNPKTLYVLYGKGNGQFFDTTLLTTQTINPHLVSGTDFNLDGKEDLMTSDVKANYADASTPHIGYYFMHVNPDSFIRKSFLISDLHVSYNAEVRSLHALDANTDGFPDLVVCNNSGLKFLLGDKNTSFQRGTTIKMGNGISPESATFADLNGDGRLDILVPFRVQGRIEMYTTAPAFEIRGNEQLIANNAPASLINATYFDTGTRSVTYTLLNTGYDPLIFDTASVFISGADTSDFAFIQFPKDTVKPYQPGIITVSFSPKKKITDVRKAQVNLVYRNCEQKPDTFRFKIQADILPDLGGYKDVKIPLSRQTLIAPVAEPEYTSRLVVQAASGFQGLLTIDPKTGIIRCTNPSPAGIFKVEVTGYNSLNQQSRTAFYLTVEPSGSAKTLAQWNQRLTDSVILAKIADFNSDLIQDIVCLNSKHDRSEIAVSPGNETGCFSRTGIIYTDKYLSAFECADFNSDGHTDLLVGQSNRNLFRLFTGNGDGTFANPRIIHPDTVEGCGYLKAGDFNRDGIWDFASIANAKGLLSVYLGDGMGKFSLAGKIQLNKDPLRQVIALGEFNADGNPDLAITNPASGTVSILQGNGLGGFSEEAELDVGMAPGDLWVADFDQNHTQDLIAANWGSSSLSLLLGKGDGTFTQKGETFLNSPPFSITGGDFNKDDNIDFAAGNPTLNSFTLLYGDGKTGFTEVKEFPTVSLPMIILAGDFNRDSTQDLAVLGGSETGIHHSGNFPNTSVRVQSRKGIIITGSMNPDKAGNTLFDEFGKEQEYILNNSSGQDIQISEIAIVQKDSFFEVTEKPDTLRSGSEGVLKIKLNKGLKAKAEVMIKNNNCMAEQSFKIASEVVPATIYNQSGNGSQVGVKVFPNPGNGKVSMQITPINHFPAGINIYDVLGRNVWSTALEDWDSKTINFQVQLPQQGMYTLRFEQKDFVQLVKILVIH